MNREEAIKSLKNIIEYWTYQPTEVESATLAISALEKQMPKKPELKLGIYFCSECGNSFNDDMNENYCNCCGQAIDWSEDNDK